MTNIKIGSQKRKRYKNNISGYKGVSPEFYAWESKSNNLFDKEERKLNTNLKWRVKITLDGKQFSFGLWKYKKQAARIYNWIAASLFGDHCYINKNVGKITNNERRKVNKIVNKYVDEISKENEKEGRPKRNRNS